MGGIVKGITGAVGGLLGATGSAPRINAPRFSGLTTPSFSLSPQGSLTRTDPFTANAEQGLFGSLASNRLANLSRLPGIQALRGQVDPLLQRTSGFFDRTAGLAGRLTNQLDTLRPGFGRVTESRVQGVRNAAGQAVGNVRSALEKRNVLGSSFANQQISQIQESFAQEEDRVRAEALVQEFQLQDQIVNEIGDLLRLDQASLQQQAGTIALQLGLNEAEGQVFAQNLAGIQTELAVLQGRITRELNELGVSGNIINQVNAIASQVAISQAKLEAQNAAAAGKSLGLFGSSLGDLFSPSGMDILNGRSGGFGFSSIFGGTGSGVGDSLVDAAGTAAVRTAISSDRRVKTDIRRVGVLDNGLPVYAFRYKSGGPTQIGVMAQDVERGNPDAVVEVSGVKHVNYDMAVL